MEKNTPTKNGPAAAAFLAAGLGCAMLGFLTVLSAIFPSLIGWLNWYTPSGPLTGQAGMAVLCWILLWVYLHHRWRDREIKKFSSVLTWLWLLLLMGYLGTFPPVFELLSGH